jgi:hypothetical protein
MKEEEVDKRLKLFGLPISFEMNKIGSSLHGKRDVY